jgi:hypothetical protein
MAEPQPLADDFWLSAHDRPDGHSLLRDQPLGMGVAAALLAELIAAGLVTLHHGRLYLETAPPWRADDTQHEVLWVLYGEAPGTPVDDVLRFLAGADRARLLIEGALDGDDYAPPRVVGERLIHRGRLSRRVPPLAVPQLRRKGLRKVWTHTPASLNDPAIPGMRIAAAAREQAPLDLHHLMLAALFRLTGLSRPLNPLGPDGARWVDGRIPGLPAPLRELLRHTELLLSGSVVR